jgi:hypothetical protein
MENYITSHHLEQKKFTLRFLPGATAVSLVEDHYAVNIWPFMNEPEGLDAFLLFIRTEIAPLIELNDLVSYQGNDLRNDVRREIINSNNIVSFGMLYQIRDFLAAFMSTLWYLDENQKVRWSEASQNNLEISQWGKELYIRGGVTELRVVENELRGELGEGFFPNFTVDAIDSDHKSLIPLSNSEKRHWMDVSDVNQNIADLMQNCGWYSSDTFTSELRTWANLYCTAYMNATGIFRHPGLDVHESILELKKVREAGKEFSYFNFPNREKFYDLLKDHKILFVTPFAAEIRQLFDSGKIWNLWKDLNIPRFHLETIQAPMSIYPNRPGSSWMDSFTQLKDSIRRSFDGNDHSLFFASTGAYGLPICDFVHSTFDIATVYDGNYINYLFGIRQNTTENDFHAGQRDIANWVTSSLGSIVGLARVDDGRYIFSTD